MQLTRTAVLMRAILSIGGSLGGPLLFSPLQVESSSPSSPSSSSLPNSSSLGDVHVDTEVPLLLRAARGENVERTPVWMMRQAGRHMKSYRDLIEKYPTFRERSEIPEAALEISLQPFRECKRCSMFHAFRRLSLVVCWHHLFSFLVPCFSLLSVLFLFYFRLVPTSKTK